MTNRTKLILFGAAGAAIIAPLAGAAVSKVIAAVTPAVSAPAAFNPWDVKRPLVVSSSAPAVMTAVKHPPKPPEEKHERTKFHPDRDRDRDDPNHPSPH